MSNQGHGTTFGGVCALLFSPTVRRWPSGTSLMVMGSVSHHTQDAVGGLPKTMEKKQTNPQVCGEPVRSRVDVTQKKTGCASLGASSTLSATTRSVLFSPQCL